MIGQTTSPASAGEGSAAQKRAMNALISGDTHDPHAVLGAHAGADGTVIRALRRHAKDVSVVVGEKSHPMKRVHEDGVYAVELPGTVLDYRLDVDGTIQDDPYRHLPTVGELDLHLIGEGRHERLWDVLGAQFKGQGVAFAVWAPSARGVRLIGDVAGWGPYDGWPMRSLGSTGVWELYVPGAAPGTKYKFKILGQDGVWREKADPLAKHTEVPPRTASVVYESKYDWQDAEWLTKRAATQAHQEPMSA